MRALAFPSGRCRCATTQWIHSEPFRLTTCEIFQWLVGWYSAPQWGHRNFLLYFQQKIVYDVMVYPVQSCTSNRMVFGVWRTCLSAIARVPTKQYIRRLHSCNLARRHPFTRRLELSSAVPIWGSYIKQHLLHREIAGTVTWSLSNIDVLFCPLNITSGQHVMWGGWCLMPVVRYVKDFGDSHRSTISRCDR